MLNAKRAINRGMRIILLGALVAPMTMLSLSACSSPQESPQSGVIERESAGDEEGREEKARATLSPQAAEVINEYFTHQIGPANLFNQMGDRDSNWLVSWEKSSTYDSIEGAETDDWTLIEYEYDEQGRKVKETDTHSGEVRREITYRYGENETIENIKQYTGSVAKEYPERTVVSRELDGGGKEEITTTPDGTEIASYIREPRKPNDTDCIAYSVDSEGNVSTNHYVFDRNGNTIRQTVHEGKGIESDPYYTFEYRYDSNGRLIHEAVRGHTDYSETQEDAVVGYSSTGETVTSTYSLVNTNGRRGYLVSFTDSDGRPIYVSELLLQDTMTAPFESTISYDADGNPVRVYTFSYGLPYEALALEYDEAGNLIRTTEIAFQRSYGDTSIACNTYRYENKETGHLTDLPALDDLVVVSFEEAQAVYDAAPLRDTSLWDRCVNTEGFWEADVPNSGNVVGIGITHDVMLNELVISVTDSAHTDIGTIESGQFMTLPGGETIVAGEYGTCLTLIPSGGYAMKISGVLFDGTEIDGTAKWHKGVTEDSYYENHPDERPVP